MKSSFLKTNVCLWVALCGPLFYVFAQKMPARSNNIPAGAIGTVCDSIKAHYTTLNKKDSQNRKQGTWLLRHDATPSEPAYIEFGDFSNNLKEGVWYHLNSEGLVTSRENYMQGVRNGAAIYFNNGQKYCTGDYRGLNQEGAYDTLYLINPETMDYEPVIYANEHSETKNGVWRYYDLYGKVIREEIYQEDSLVSRRDFAASAGNNGNKEVPQKKKHWVKGQFDENRSLIR